MTRISLYKVLLNLICAFLNIIQANHRTITLEDHSLYKIKEMSNLTHFNEILDNILIPRVVGSNGHDKVYEYIVKSMRNIDWNVEIDEFQDSTPFGVLTFRNIISTNNVNAANYLILACHYDSKFFKDKDFLGATDSAVPCAMMINVVYSLRKQLGENQTNKLGLMLIFFDGEEAFERWSATDSLYGARHLANKWEEEDFLEKINLFILLDLLGSPDPQFYSYFKNTEDWYAYLLYSEKRLADIGLFDKYLYSSVVDKSPLQYFQPHSISALIEDDHIPFMQRGVKIIHLIPSPFPEVWHKMDDDRMAIDIYTVENLNKILRLFLVEYLHLNF